MATYDGTFHVIDGKKKPTTRAGRIRRLARDRLRAIAVQRLKLACRLRDLAGWLEGFARDDLARTTRDLTGVARDLTSLAAELLRLTRIGLASASRLLSSAGRDIKWLATGLTRLAWDGLTSASRLLLNAGRTLGESTRGELERTAGILASLAAKAKRRTRDDLERTARALVSLGRTLGTIARDVCTRTARDFTNWAGWIATFARDDFMRTVEDLQRLAVHSIAIADRLAVSAGHLQTLASRLLKTLAGHVERKARELKTRAGIQSRQVAMQLTKLAALPGQFLDKLGRTARLMQVSTAREVSRLGGETAKAGAALWLEAGDRSRRFADRGRALASLTATLTHRVALSGRSRYQELAGYIDERAEHQRQAASVQARLKADERLARRQLAEDEAMQKTAERQAKLEIAEEQARKKIAAQEARKIVAQEAKLKIAEQKREAALARKKAAEEARAASARVPQKEVVAAGPQEKPVDRPRRVLILVENLPSPFDRRVWQEANALRDAGYLVSIICPTGKGYEKKFEDIGGIHIWRYELPFEANGAFGYLAEYATALARTWMLSWRVFFGRGFDAIHACNPPDLLFVIGGFFKLLGKKFLFDHHDINPELYEAKFGRRDFFYRALIVLERWSFRSADVSIATNESYRGIAIERGGMPAERVFVVRSGPSLERMKIVPADERLKRGRRHLVGYVGVMGKQEGIDCLLRAVRLIVCRYRRTDIHFGLVGGGTSLEEMKALAVRLEVAEYITFTGRVPDAELLAMLNTADVCVNPDIASEMNDKSTMNKIMEYMALGKPIVQFDLTEGRYSARGAALNARRGDVADFALRILELIDNPELRQRMGAAGRERVLNALSWDHEVPKLLAAYECLWRGPEPSALAHGGAAS